MDAHEFLKTLAIVLGVAAVTTVIFQRLKQPVVLGYIIAGLLVGPHVAVPLHADTQTVHVLSELGIILLMFSIGLELSVAKLIKVAPTAGVIGVVQVAIMMTAGYYAGRLFHWSPMECVFAGAAIAISSTTIIAKAFEELKVDAELRDLVYGVLIVEDIIAILLLTTMNTVSSGVGLDLVTLTLTTGKLLLFLLVMVLVGVFTVPRAIRRVVALGRNETTVVAGIGICFVFAYAAAALHYSVALGAFVAGMLVSESGEGHAVEHAIVPIRDMFAAIFFVSVGMLIDPRLVLENWLAVLVFTVLVVVGKVLGVAFGAVLTGATVQRSVQAGMSLAQIGEFSFILVGLGLTLGQTRTFLYPVAVAVSAITTLITPSAIKHSVATGAWVESRLPARVRSVIDLYVAWVGRLKRQPADVAQGVRVRRLLLLLLLDYAALAGLLIGSTFVHQRVAAWAQAKFGLDDFAFEGAFALGALLLGAPFCVGIVRLARSLALLVTAGDALESLPESRARRSLAALVQLVILIALGAATVAILEPLLPIEIGAPLLVGFAAFALIALWRTSRRFQIDAHAGAGSVLHAVKAQLQADGSHEPSP